MTKVEGEKDGAPAATTSTNPGQSNTSKTDQGEVPAIATNHCVWKQRRGVAGDRIQRAILAELRKLNENVQKVLENLQLQTLMKLAEARGALKCHEEYRRE
jgi:hypothetical protein